MDEWRNDKDLGLIELLLRHLLGGTEENNENILVMVAAVPAENRTGHLAVTRSIKFGSER
jgi:hypothetical protein